MSKFILLAKTLPKYNTTYTHTHTELKMAPTENKYESIIHVKPESRISSLVQILQVL